MQKRTGSYSGNVLSKVAVDGRLYNLDYLPGWEPLVEGIAAAIDIYAPKGTISQVKEKYGALRVYVQNTHSEAVFAVIDFAELVSQRMCIDCGKNTEMKENNGWYFPQCSECSSKTP